MKTANSNKFYCEIINLACFIFKSGPHNISHLWVGCPLTMLVTCFSENRRLKQICQRGSLSLGTTAQFLLAFHAPLPYTSLLTCAWIPVVCAHSGLRYTVKQRMLTLVPYLLTVWHWSNSCLP